MNTDKSETNKNTIKEKRNGGERTAYNFAGVQLIWMCIFSFFKYCRLGNVCKNMEF